MPAKRAMATNGKHYDGGGQRKPPKSFASGDEANAYFKGVTDGLSEGETRAVKFYTDSGYTLINNTLRSGGAATDEVRQLDSALAKGELKEPITVYRGSSASFLGVPAGQSASLEYLQSLKGRSFSDLGFMSTSVLRDGAFNKEITYKITVPKGKGRGMYVDSISTFKGEREFLLARGTRFRITNVTTEGGSPLVHLRAL